MYSPAVVWLTIVFAIFYDARGREHRALACMYVMHMHEFPVLMQQPRSLHDAAQLFGRWNGTYHTLNGGVGLQAQGIQSRYIRYGSVRTFDAMDSQEDTETYSPVTFSRSDHNLRNMEYR